MTEREDNAEVTPAEWPGEEAMIKYLLADAKWLSSVLPPTSKRMGSKSYSHKYLHGEDMAGLSSELQDNPVSEEWGIRDFNAETDDALVLVRHQKGRQRIPEIIPYLGSIALMGLTFVTFGDQPQLSYEVQVHAPEAYVASVVATLSRSLLPDHASIWLGIRNNPSDQAAQEPDDYLAGWRFNGIYLHDKTAFGAIGRAAFIKQPLTLESSQFVPKKSQDRALRPASSLEIDGFTKILQYARYPL